MNSLNSDQPTTRICRKCSVQTDAAGAYCPSCGTPFVRKSRRPTRRAVILAVVVTVLLAGAGTALAVKRSNDAANRTDAAAATERAAEREATRLSDLQAAEDDDERESRSRLVEELEKNVSKYAKKLVKDGLIEGPIKYASCTATGGGSTDDLTALTGTFECLAVNKENDDGTASGYSFAGTTEWATGEMTWKLGD